MGLSASQRSGVSLGVTAGLNRRRQAPLRSGRHRRGRWSRLTAEFADWFHEPHNFEWVITHRSTRSLYGMMRAVFATSTIWFALCSVVMLWSSHGPEGRAARTWVCILLLIQIVVAIRWCVGPMPAQRSFIAFAIFGDLGLTSVLMLFDPAGALVGSVLFSVIGALCTFFLSARLLVAHLTWASGVILVSAGSAYVNGVEDLATVVVATLVVFAAVNGVPLFAHVGWTAVSRDARNSSLDSLTGLYNRRGLSNALTDLWECARRRGGEITAVVIDIDKFKLINDRYGHSVGDAVIVTIADILIDSTVDRTIRSASRGECVLARTGGEEFVAVLLAPPGQSRAGLDALQGVFREQVDASLVPPVTVSIGGAILTADSPLNELGEAVLERVIRAGDEAMYRAKKAGGGQTVIDTV